MHRLRLLIVCGALLALMPAPVSAKPSNSCGGLFQRLLASKPALTPAQELALRLSTDQIALKRQALELKELRLLNNAGRLTDPKRKLMLEALEYRANELNLLLQKEERNFQALRAQIEDNAYLNKDKVDALGKLFETGHPERVAVLKKALDHRYFQIRDEARRLLVEAGENINYQRVIDDLASSANRAFRQEDNPELREIVLDELRFVSDENYLKVLEKLKGKARNLALQAASTRPTEMVSELLEKGSALDRYTLIDSVLRDRFDWETHQLLSELAQRDPERSIREVCAKLLQERSHREDDLKFMEKFMSLPEKEAIALAKRLASRSPGTVMHALEHPEPRVRAAVFRAIEGRNDTELVSAVVRALEEPVNEVRAAAIDFMSSRRDAVSRGLFGAAVKTWDNQQLWRLAEAKTTIGGRTISEAARIAKARKRFLQSLSAEDRRIEAHVQAFDAADNVYLLPELETVKTPEELVDQYQAFRESVPARHSIKETASDPHTGFKMVRYVTEDQANREIVAIGGTQTWLDVLADGNMGISQMRSPVYLDAVDKVVRELLEKPSKRVMVTGHSLGGAMAQAFAHDVVLAAKKRQADIGNILNRIEVVTWNALGAVDPLRRLGRFDEQVARGLSSVNYYVPGDVVSQIGRHIGELRALPKQEGAGAISAHLTSTIEEQLQKGQIGRDAAEVSYWSSIVGPILSRSVGWLTDLVQKFHLGGRTEHSVATILKARQIWAEREGFRDLNDDWLRNELNAMLSQTRDMKRLQLERAATEAETKRQLTLKRLRAAPQF